LERNPVGMRVTVGRELGLLGVVCAVVGIFFLEGISIEFVGIMLGGLGLLQPDRPGPAGADPRDRRSGPQRRLYGGERP
jgi:hypothetical protein